MCINDFYIAKDLDTERSKWSYLDLAMWSSLVDGLVECGLNSIGFGGIADLNDTNKLFLCDDLDEFLGVRQYTPYATSDPGNSQPIATWMLTAHLVETLRRTPPCCWGAGNQHYDTDEIVFFDCDRVRGRLATIDGIFFLYAWTKDEIKLLESAAPILGNSIYSWKNRILSSH